MPRSSLARCSAASSRAWTRRRSRAGAASCRWSSSPTRSRWSPTATGAPRRRSALLEPEWDFGAAGNTDSAQFAKLYREALDGPMVKRATTAMSMPPCRGKGGKVVEAHYEVPHARACPDGAAQRHRAFRRRPLDVWVGTQIPMARCGLAARASGVKPEQSLHPQLLPRRRLRPALGQRRNGARRSRSPSRSASRSS